jgi:hypothetical protein
MNMKEKANVSASTADADYGSMTANADGTNVTVVNGGRRGGL